VGDHSHKPTGVFQVGQRLHRPVKRLLVEASKALVDEEGLQVAPPRDALNDIVQAEGERKSGHESLPTRECRDRPPISGVGIVDQKIQARTDTSVPDVFQPKKSVPILCHVGDVLIGDAENLL